MTPPVRILYHNPAMASSRDWIGERGRQLIEAMRRVGAAVEAIPAFELAEAPQGDGSGGWRRRIWEHLPQRTHGAVIRLRLIQRGTFNSMLWTWRSWRNLRRNPPDVVVARYRELEWTPLLVAALLRRPLVLEAHTPAAVEHIVRGGRRSRFLEWMDRQMFRRAEVVWVHNPELERLVLGLGAKEATVRLIPFGIEDRGVRADPGRATKAVEVAFVGSFFTWHGVAELVLAFDRALHKAPDLRLTMMGDGVARHGCEALVSRLGLGESVVFTGWLTPEEMYTHLQKSHIGVAPYLDTAYNHFEPVKILDYQMAGLPIVASRVGHIPKMVADGESGVLVPPGDVEALEAALVRLAGDPVLRESMGRAAHLQAHRIGDTAEAVVEVCRSVAMTTSD